MLKKLGKSITIANATAFLVVILVGGISIYLTQNILHNTHKIQKISNDIVKVNGIHSDAYRLVLSMYHFLIDENKMYSQESVKLITDLRTKASDYLASELKELSMEKNQEIALLNEILNDAKGLKAVEEILKEFSGTGKYDRDTLIEMEQFAYDIEANTSEINKIHLRK